jgi:hypothetical protein
MVKLILKKNNNNNSNNEQPSYEVPWLMKIKIQHLVISKF